MMDIVPFHVLHAEAITLQYGQTNDAPMLSHKHAVEIEQLGDAFTALDDNLVLGFAGVTQIWQGRGLAYAYLSQFATQSRFLFIHRATKRYLDTCFLRRIEMTVDIGFDAGHRWAKMLGFKMEAECMKGYRPDGGDCALYARVRP